MSIHVQNVTKRFGSFVALNNVSLKVPAGALLALLGPSGSGKTTLLRIIGGLETPDSGSVAIEDQDVTHHNPRERNLGFVFQHYALFRNLNVFENIAFALRVRKWKEADVRARAHELLKLIRLENLERRKPSELSGGQRQRVALARALAAEPRVLLLDEPFGALDAKVRQELRQWLRRFHDDLGVTSVFVTHDQEEAFEVSDQVVVMNQGRIEQMGSPAEIFDHPANAFVMDFLGNVNVFHGRVQNGRALLGGVEVDFPEYPHAQERAAKLFVRPHELDLQRHSNGVGTLQAKVLHVNPAGSVGRVQLIAPEFPGGLTVELSQEHLLKLALKSGETVYVAPRKVRAFVEDYAI